MSMRSKAVSVVMVLARVGSLQDAALLVLGAATARKQSSAGGVLENLVDALVGLGGALEVLVGTNLLADFLSLFHVLVGGRKRVACVRGSWPYECRRIHVKSRNVWRAELRRRVTFGVAWATQNHTEAQGLRHTSAGLTGCWSDLDNSSETFWSPRRSFLQPTRMMGRPWQK